MSADNRKFLHVAAGAGLLMVLAGCTSGEDKARPDAGQSIFTPSGAEGGIPLLPSLPPGGHRLSCADSIGTTPGPPAGYRVIAGTVAVPDEVLQPNESDGDPGPTRMFAKWGLLVQAGEAVEVQLAPGWEDRARIGWGQPGERVTTVQVEACPAGTQSEPWSVFTGGTWVAEPACVPLVIRSRGQQVDVDLSIGVACAGNSGR